MKDAGEGRRANVLKELSSLFEKHRQLAFPVLEGLPQSSGTGPDVGSKLLMYDSAVAGWVERTLEGKALSEIELHNLRAGAAVDRALDDLARDRRVHSECVDGLRRYKASLDELARLVKTVQLQA